MAIDYRNPPIVEAVCEFRIPSEIPWDAAIPGVLYERMKERYPERRPRMMSAVRHGVQDGAVSQEIRAVEAIQFLSRDGLDLVQVAPHLVSVNRLRPYDGWGRFSAGIEAALEDMRQAITDLPAFERIGLRYINSFEFPGAQIDLDEYFDLAPRLGNRLPQTLATFFVNVEIPMADTGGICRAVLRTGAAPGPETTAVILDIEHYSASSETVSADEALSYIGAAHDAVKGIFEGAILSALREHIERDD